MIKKNLLLSSILFLSLMQSACKTTQSNLESKNSATSGSAPYLGCRKVSKATSAVHNAAMDILMKDLAQLCVSYTPNSRSGDYTFNFKDKNGADINSVGFSKVDTARCMNCYSFSGFEGTSVWRGEIPNQPITIDFDLHPYGGKFEAKADQNSFDPSKPYLGCFEMVSVQSSVKNVAMKDFVSKSKVICGSETPNSRGGQFSFSFQEKSGKVLTISAFDTIDLLRCPGCFRFKGLEGTLNWTGGLPGDPINVNLDSKPLGGDVSFEVESK